MKSYRRKSRRLLKFLDRPTKEFPISVVEFLRVMDCAMRLDYKARVLSPFAAPAFNAVVHGVLFVPLVKEDAAP